MMKKAQQGFTLIELMIVVAIIGILAAVAIPAYQDYTAKAQASEAMTLLGGLKTPISESISLSGLASGCTAPGTVVTKGKYVASVTIAPSGTVCVATATYVPSGANAKINGQVVWLAFDPVAGGWNCTSNLVDAVRPKVCAAASAIPTTPTT
jgi:type IV pilus assembly protein PilA